jgi:DNA topoisomerase-3
MQVQVDATREFSRALLEGKLTDGQMVMHACPACGGSRCAQLKSKAGNVYHRCMDCQAAFGDDGGKPGKRFEDRPAGETAQKTSSAAGAGPKCPTCKGPTARMKASLARSGGR